MCSGACGFCWEQWRKFQKPSICGRSGRSMRRSAISLTSRVCCRRSRSNGSTVAWSDLCGCQSTSPFSMHSCWTCLFGYTTNANYTGNSVAFCDWVKQLFITEAANEEDGVADLAFSQVDTERMQDSDVDLEFSQVDAWPMKQVFERSARLCTKHAAECHLHQ